MNTIPSVAAIPMTINTGFIFIAQRVDQASLGAERKAIACIGVLGVLFLEQIAV